jgi:hypothetical protein
VSWFNNFFRKKDEVEYEYVTRDIPFSTLIRWFIYDTALIEPNEAAQILGITPVSEEGDDKEMEDSEIRLESIQDLMPFIMTMAELCSTALTKIHAHEISNGDETVGEEEMDSMKSMYLLVSLSSIVTSFASAIELNLISKDALLTGMSRVDEEYKDEQ